MLTLRFASGSQWRLSLVCQNNHLIWKWPVACPCKCFCAFLFVPIQCIASIACAHTVWLCSVRGWETSLAMAWRGTSLPFFSSGRLHAAGSRSAARLDPREPHGCCPELLVRQLGLNGLMADESTVKDGNCGPHSFVIGFCNQQGQLKVCLCMQRARARVCVDRKSVV